MSAVPRFFFRKLRRWTERWRRSRLRRAAGQKDARSEEAERAVALRAAGARLGWRSRRRVAFADPDPPVVAAAGQAVCSLGAQVVGDGGNSRGLHRRRRRRRAASENHGETLSSCFELTNYSSS